MVGWWVDALGNPGSNGITFTGPLWKSAIQKEGPYISRAIHNDQLVGPAFVGHTQLAWRRIRSFEAGPRDIGRFPESWFGTYAMWLWKNIHVNADASPEDFLLGWKIPFPSWKNKNDVSYTPDQNSTWNLKNEVPGNRKPWCSGSITTLATWEHWPQLRRRRISGKFRAANDEQCE